MTTVTVYYVTNDTFWHPCDTLAHARHLRDSWRGALKDARVHVDAIRRVRIVKRTEQRIDWDA